MRPLLRCLLVAATMLPLCALADGPAATPRYVDVPGAKLYVETFGSGTPLLFLHGGLHFFDNSFAAQRDYFAAFRQVIGIDQAGHGHSPGNGRPFTYQQMADDTAAVIEKLRIGPVDIVGHSDGANVALILAHDHPALVQRLVISGANLRPALSPEKLQQRARATPTEIAERVHAMEQTLPPNFRTDFLAVAPGGVAQWDTMMVKSYAMWIMPVAVDPASLKAIESHVLVIAGDTDFTPLDQTIEIYRALPHAQLFIVPGTGHGTFGDRPELMNLAIREFLEKR